jgi:hypothetical protein
MATWVLRCGFWENLRYKNVEHQPWVAPCNVREVGRLAADLKARGMDLDLFEPSDLFRIIRGRTLWCAKLAPKKKMLSLCRALYHACDAAALDWVLCTVACMMRGQ